MPRARAAHAPARPPFNVPREEPPTPVAPTVGQSRAWSLSSRRRYPFVTEFITWNEGNHHSQPTARRPRLAARYYETARRACPRCTVLAADLLDDDSVPKWVQAFRRHRSEERRVGKECRSRWSP